MTQRDPMQTTLADLHRELAELKRAVLEDKSDRDHWLDGRWPMIHRIADQIDKLQEKAP